MGIYVRRSDANNLPEAFRVEQDLERGLFVGADGERLTADSFKAELAKPGNKILRVRFLVRRRGDKPDAPLRLKTAIAILGGRLTPEELTRAIYRLAREQYSSVKKDG